MKSDLFISGSDRTPGPKGKTGDTAYATRGILCSVIISEIM